MVKIMLLDVISFKYLDKKEKLKLLYEKKIKCKYILLYSRYKIWFLKYNFINFDLIKV